MEELYEVRPKTALLWGCLSGLMTTSMYLCMVYTAEAMALFTIISGLALKVGAFFIVVAASLEAVIQFLKLKHYANLKGYSMVTLARLIIRRESIRGRNSSK